MGFCWRPYAAEFLHSVSDQIQNIRYKLARPPLTITQEGRGPQIDKHLPQSPSTGQFFDKKFFALPSLSLTVYFYKCNYSKKAMKKIFSRPFWLLIQIRIYNTCCLISKCVFCFLFQTRTALMSLHWYSGLVTCRNILSIIATPSSIRLIHRLASSTSTLAATLPGLVLSQPWPLIKGTVS